jgi:hypothetical protein
MSKSNFDKQVADFAKLVSSYESILNNPLSPVQDNGSSRENQIDALRKISKLRVDSLPKEQQSRLHTEFYRLRDRYMSDINPIFAHKIVRVIDEYGVQKPDDDDEPVIEDAFDMYDPRLDKLRAENIKRQSILDGLNEGIRVNSNELERHLRESPDIDEKYAPPNIDDYKRQLAKINGQISDVGEKHRVIVVQIKEANVANNDDLLALNNDIKTAESVHTDTNEKKQRLAESLAERKLEAENADQKYSEKYAANMDILNAHTIYITNTENRISDIEAKIGEINNTIAEKTELLVSVTAKAATAEQEDAERLRKLNLHEKKIVEYKKLVAEKKRLENQAEASEAAKNKLLQSIRAVNDHLAESDDEQRQLHELKKKHADEKKEQEAKLLGFSEGETKYAKASQALQAQFQNDSTESKTLENRLTDAEDYAKLVDELNKINAQFKDDTNSHIYARYAGRFLLGYDSEITDDEKTIANDMKNLCVDRKTGNVRTEYKWNQLGIETIGGQGDSQHVNAAEIAAIGALSCAATSMIIYKIAGLAIIILAIILILLFIYLPSSKYYGQTRCAEISGRVF